MPADSAGSGPDSNYSFTDFGQISADIEAMSEYAKRLAATLEDSYVPDMSRVSQSMRTVLPATPVEFRELTLFLNAHEVARTGSQENIYGYANRTRHFSVAADTISQEYAGSDAFARTKVTDVDSAFRDAERGNFDDAAGDDA